MNEDTFVYRIDKRDYIVRVNRNWASFARANGWGREFSPGKVVGHLLWDFIHDRETRYLYKELFKRVRAGRSCGPIPFRCDSPRERRFLLLVLSPLTDGHIEITSTIERTEHRDPVRLLDNDMQRSGDLIRICSMCKKIAISPNDWFEIEEGVARLRLFDAGEIPGLTHSVCPACFQAVMAELDDSEP